MCAFAVYRRFFTFERGAARGESPSESSFSSAAVASFMEACRPPARTMPRRMPLPPRLPSNDSRKGLWVAGWGRVISEIIVAKYCGYRTPRAPHPIAAQKPQLACCQGETPQQPCRV